MEKYLFSIITVVFNGEDALEKTIESVINQNYKNFEFIIIDGNSSDNTVEIIKKYDKYIDLWISRPDKGIYDAMNKGIKMANGYYLHFLNAGDTYYDKFTLQNIAEIIILKKPDLLIGGTQKVSKSEGISFYEFFKIYSPISFYRKGKMVCHQAIFYNYQTFKAIGKYSLEYEVVADHEWMYRYLFSSEEKRISYINMPVVYYDITGISANRRQQVIKERIRLAKLYNPRYISYMYTFFFSLIEYMKFQGILILKKLNLYKKYRKRKYQKRWKN